MKQKNIALEVVANQLCEKCIIERVEKWLNYEKPELIPEFKIIASQNGYHNHNNFGTKCIKCGEKVNSCSYCFTEQILSWLKKSFKNPKLFNF